MNNSVAPPKTVKPGKPVKPGESDESSGPSAGKRGSAAQISTYRYRMRVGSV